MANWTDEDLLDLGANHGCLTGDCPHATATDCANALADFANGLVGLTLRQRDEIERLRSELEMERGHRQADNTESREEIKRLLAKRDECRRLLREAIQKI